MSTTTIAQAKYEGITCSTIALNASVTGKVTNIINFIIGLNDGYTTGNVQSAQMTIAAPTDEDSEPDSSTATVSMIIYSYEGK